VSTTWTLPELVSEVAARIAALPAPKNGQVRAVPDDRTVRYYATIGLLDRPLAMRGRTALYGARHVAQVVAIKRLQTMGRSLAEIQALWPTLDDPTLARMSGVPVEALEPVSQAPVTPSTRGARRDDFWKRDPAPAASINPTPSGPMPMPMIPMTPGAPPAPRVPMPPPGPSIPIVPAPPPEMPPGSAGAPVMGVVMPVSSPTATASVGAVELRVELAPHVFIVLALTDDTIAISPADVRAIRAAAAPLVAELASRRLASHPVGGEP
jgi:hypothetical protein